MGNNPKSDNSGSNRKDIVRRRVGPVELAQDDLLSPIAVRADMHGAEPNAQQGHSAKLFSSPPLRVDAACQTCKSTSSLMARTAPSIIATFTMPG
jgi:hypothetical protein